MDDTPIDCPACHYNTWRLAKYEYGDGAEGLRVTCTVCGKVDNVTHEDSKVKIVWELIEDDGRH